MVKIQRKAKPEISRGKRGLHRNKHNTPDFNALFRASTITPVDPPPTDDPETAAADELRAMLQTIAEEKRRRREMYRTQIDPEFWFAICFQDRAQKEEFLKTVGWFDLGDKYLDGIAVAERMGVQLTVKKLKPKKPPRAPKLLRKEVISDA